MIKMETLMMTKIKIFNRIDVAFTVLTLSTSRYTQLKQKAGPRTC